MFWDHFDQFLCISGTFQSIWKVVRWKSVLSIIYSQYTKSSLWPLLWQLVFSFWSFTSCWLSMRRFWVEPTLARLSWSDLISQDAPWKVWAPLLVCSCEDELISKSYRWWVKYLFIFTRAQGFEALCSRPFSFWTTWAGPRSTLPAPSQTCFRSMLSSLTGSPNNL